MGTRIIRVIYFVNYINIYSLCYTPKTNIILYVNCNWKILKLLKIQWKIITRSQVLCASCNLIFKTESGTKCSFEFSQNLNLIKLSLILVCQKKKKKSSGGREYGQLLRSFVPRGSKQRRHWNGSKVVGWFVHLF